MSISWILMHRSVKNHDVKTPKCLNPGYCVTKVSITEIMMHQGVKNMNVNTQKYQSPSY